MASVVYQVFETFKDDVQYVEICCLLFFLVVCLAHLFWKPSRIAVLSEKKNSTRRSDLSNKKMLLNECYEYTKNKKESVMRPEDELLIESIILDEYDRCH